MRANPRNIFVICFIFGFHIFNCYCDPQTSTKLGVPIEEKQILQSQQHAQFNPNKDKVTLIQIPNIPIVEVLKQDILIEELQKVVIQTQSDELQNLRKSRDSPQILSNGQNAIIPDLTNLPKIQQEQLKPWIYQQIQHYKSHYQSTERQSFSFILDPENIFQFKWNSFKKAQLLLSIRVFQVLKTGGITPILDSEQNEYIDIQMREDGKTYYASIGQVYVSKKLTAKFDGDKKHFRFASRRTKSVLVMVELQKMEITVKLIDGEYDMVKDQHLQFAVRNLQFIKKEVISVQKQLEYTQKCNQSYMNNDILYQSRLLSLASLQTTMIVGSALLQLYLIKNLITLRQII